MARISKLSKISRSITTLNNKFARKTENFLATILLLSGRLWMGSIFFQNGKGKFFDIDSTIFLFEYKYNLPFISPLATAYMTAFFEISCSILLICGLLARFSAIILIILTLTIQILIFDNIEYFYWLFLLSMIMVYGSGKISIDGMLKIK